MVSEHTARHKFSANLLAYTFSRVLRDDIAIDRWIVLGVVGLGFRPQVSSLPAHTQSPC